MRTAGVILLAAALVGEGVRLRTQASEKFVRNAISLDETGRLAPVYHVAVRQIAEDPSASPAWRELANEALASMISYSIEQLEWLDRGEIDTQYFTRDEIMLSTARTLAVGDLRPDHRELLRRAYTQILEECGVPQPCTREAATRWFVATYGQVPGRNYLNTHNCSQETLDASDAYDAEVKSRRTRLAQTYQPTRKPLR